jgi:plasmid maintenance system antidote protein VapI
MSVKSNGDVAGKVRGLAAQHRVSHAELATTLNLSSMAFSRRVNGHTPFTPEELIRVADRLGTSVAELFGERS